MRIILEWTEHYPDLVEQLLAANIAIRQGFEGGDLFGVRMGATGNCYGVKRNAESVRVYRQTEATH